MYSNNKHNKHIPVSMNKMSNNLYANTYPPNTTSYQGVTGQVLPYRTAYDQQLNNKYCYSPQNIVPNRYQS